MAKEATLSTVIDGDVKEAVTRFCQEHGLKLRYLIERALVELLEDAVDMEAYQARRSEPTLSLDRILSSRKKKK